MKIKQIGDQTYARHWFKWYLVAGTILIPMKRGRKDA